MHAATPWIPVLNDKDAPLYSHPPLADKQIRQARADFEVMQMAGWRWHLNGQPMTPHEMMYIAASLQRETGESPGHPPS